MAIQLTIAMICCSSLPNHQSMLTFQGLGTQIHSPPAFERTSSKTVVDTMLIIPLALMVLTALMCESRMHVLIHRSIPVSQR
jgi:hypothetical protein